MQMNKWFVDYVAVIHWYFLIDLLQKHFTYIYIWNYIPKWFKLSAEWKIFISNVLMIIIVKFNKVFKTASQENFSLFVSFGGCLLWCIGCCSMFNYTGLHWQRNKICTEPDRLFVAIYPWSKNVNDSIFVFGVDATANATIIHKTTRFFILDFHTLTPATIQTIVNVKLNHLFCTNKYLDLSTWTYQSLR